MDKVALFLVLFSVLGMDKKLKAVKNLCRVVTDVVVRRGEGIKQNKIKQKIIIQSILIQI